jgi:superfamily II DNA helicase RecQ
MSKIKIFNLKLTTEGVDTQELDEFVENVKVLNIWEHLLSDKDLWVILLRYEENQYIHPKKEFNYPNKKINIEKTENLENLTTEEQERFNALKQWRKSQVQDSNRPAYSVFNDQVLYDISRKNPKSITELKSIRGIGESKLTQYGESLLKLLNIEHKND